MALYLGEGRYIHSTGAAVSGGVVINSLEPVSYTHLDVYKRQGLNAAVDLAAQAAFHDLTLALGRDIQTCLLYTSCDAVAAHHDGVALGEGQVGHAAEAEADGAVDCGAGAVSYTHLDVYKRQACGRPRPRGTG